MASCKRMWDGEGGRRRACATCTACSSASSAAWRRRTHASRPAARCSATASAVAPASRSPAGARRVMRRARGPCGSGRREHAATRAGTAGPPSCRQPRRLGESRQARARAAVQRTRAALPGGLRIMQPTLCAGYLCGSRRGLLGCGLGTEQSQCQCPSAGGCSTVLAGKHVSPWRLHSLLPGSLLGAASPPPPPRAAKTLAA